MDTKSVVCYLMMLYLRIYSSSLQTRPSSSSSGSKEAVGTPPLLSKHTKQYSSGGSSIQSGQIGVTNLANESEKNANKIFLI